MAKEKMAAEVPVIIWKDRKHHLWFPISFSKYSMSEDRLYTESGFFTSHYDELLLYRVIDLRLTRNLAQKIFGTGTITLCTKADTDREIFLKNIKHPVQTKALISELVEKSRDKKRVVGKEFFGDPGHVHGEDGEMEDFLPMDN